MKPLLFAILIPVLILGALRAELTPWRLLSRSEHEELRTKIAALEQEVAQAKKVVQAQHEKVASGAWMREEQNRTPLDKGAPAGPFAPGKPR